MITVLGTTGYIGSNILHELRSQKKEIYAPERGENLLDKELGDIIYCVGMTADFRTKPFETAEAHVCLLNDILRDCRFKSLTYLSSARVYINSTKNIAEENDKILIDPTNADELYTLTKLTGERLCLSSGRDVKIIRLSNIYGRDFNSDNFLTDIIRTIYNEGYFKLFSSLSSSKDYLFIDDTVKIIIDIALRGKQAVYNVASGENTSNEEIINELQRHLQFSYSIAENGKEFIFPQISISRIQAEFNFKPQNISDQILTLLK